jgi:CubicO group peptidase (beta-lactamase class C family)
MKFKQKFWIGILCIATLCGSYTYGESQTIPSDDIDSLVQRAMETFDVPGVAVAIIEDGEVTHRRGYGRRSLHSEAEVDDHTLFAIASNSKAFTCAALGILIDENKISGWDDKVRIYIPEFQLYNPYVSAEFTIRDLLTHRSGLGLGAGDLMIYPDENDYTIEELIDNLRHLQPVSGFRSEYAYDNLLYIVAGEIISRVSGMSWVEFIEKRIMKPLGMERSVGTY